MASLSQVWILQVLYLHQHPVIWRMKAAKRLDDMKKKMCVWGVDLEKKTIDI